MVETSENQLLASICRDSFFEFVKEFWREVISEEPVYNWHIPYICGQLQRLAERVFQKEPKKGDLVINVSPGSTKSTICSWMFPAWVWTRMPTAQFICVSYSYNLATDLSRKNRDLINSEKYKQLFPHIRLREDQNTKQYFMTTEGGFRFCSGTGGVTGYHGHFIIVDDPLNPNEAVSEAELKSANRWMMETLFTRKVDKAVTPVILIQQRLHQDDPSANMLEKAQREDIPIKHINLPAVKTKFVRPKKLKKMYVDDLFDPIRLDRKVLKEMRSNLGEFAYAGQFLQNPVPLGGGMFKTSRVKVDSPPRHWIKRVRYWDKAGTLKGGAYTVGVLMGKDYTGRFWVLDVVRGRWESAEREAVIRQTAELDGKSVVVAVEQEPGSGGKESAENTVRNLAGFRVKVDRPKGDKILRADTFSVQVNAGNVYITPAEWNSIYLNELGYFPFSKYKDQVDASSGAFSQLVQKGLGYVGGLRRSGTKNVRVKSSF